MNVVLTGASKGIGYNACLSMAKRNIKNLVVISRNALLLEQLKEECKAVAPNVNVTIIAEDLLKLVKKPRAMLRDLDLEHVDILINNAGLLINKPFAEYSVSEAKKVFDINFHAPAALINILLPLLQKSPLAHVINISSIGGFQGSSKYPGLSYYSASKAALASLTECLAVEFSDSDIKYNCLALGAVQTEMLNEAFPGFEAPVTAEQMGEYIADFAINGHKFYNGQILPVHLGNP